MGEQGKDDKAGRNPAGALTSFTLEEALRTARATPQWASGDRFANSLVKHRDFTITLMLLRKGAQLNEHRARGSISVQLLAGAIRFAAAGAVKDLHAGMMCVLDAEIPHAVEAVEESAILLTAALPPAASS